MVGGEVDDRRATWLELFFDLVFVAAVGQLANALSSHPTFPRFLGFLAVFVPVWWAWMGFTFYANRFDTDDLPYRLLTLLGMFLVAVLATTVRNVFDGHSSGFVVAYLGVRLILLVLYDRARRHVPEARRLTQIFLVAFGTATAFWLGSLALPAPARYWLWAVALVLELGAPLLAWRQLPNAPIHPRHIPERFGLLTLIVLGESVLGVAHVPWGAASGAAAAAGFVAAASLWWIYFDFLDETTVSARGLWGGLTYTYMHFFVVVGLATMGAAVKLAVFAAGGEARYDDTSWILCAGLALTMVGLAAIQLVTPPVLFNTDVRLRLATAAVALVFVPFGLRPLVVVLVLSGLLVAQVAYELLAHEEHAAAYRRDLVPIAAIFDARRGRRRRGRPHASTAEAGPVLGLLEPLGSGIEPVKEPLRDGVLVEAHDSELPSIVRRVDVLEDVPLVRASLVRLDVRVDDLAGLLMNDEIGRHG